LGPKVKITGQNTYLHVTYVN